MTTPAETNRLVAERVMGWTDGEQQYGAPGWLSLGFWTGWATRELRDDDSRTFIEHGYFDPAHDERDCMRALEKMREMGWTVRAGMTKDGGWYVVCESANPFQPHWRSFLERGPTFCAAACKAIVKAMED